MIAWMLVLAMFAGPASALGLGPIEVRSQRDQPLLAEIQVISNDPSELDRLQARLASPETFARIGLQPPQGIVSDLQFALALDAAGRPVIRVTSAAPVQQALLTFLVEVDWGQGRLVREYSALLDAPRTVAAPSQPPIQAPVVQPSNVVVRPPVPAVAPPQPEEALASGPTTPTGPGVPQPPASAAPREAGVDPDAVAASAPEPTTTPVPAPAPAPAPPPAQAAVPATPTADAGEYGPVKAGETLGAIAAGVRGEDETLEQAMVALLRANPEAFIGGNLNLVRQGAVLRVPASAERSQYSAAEAAAVVRAQVGEWRALRRPVQQPDAVVDAPAAPSASAPAGAAPAARAAAARLEIVPPSQGGGQRAGTRSGIDAGGEGEMLRQELLQKDEALAARGAEVEELKARVADLERLQSQQQQLIQLKDNELAAAQQRLATTSAQPAPGAVASTPADRGGMDASVLVWAGAALVLAALLVAWLLRRRRPRVATPVFDTAALAAAVPARAVGAGADGRSRPPVVAASEAPGPAPTSGAAPATVAPTWHAGPTDTNRISPDVPASSAAPHMAPPVEPSEARGAATPHADVPQAVSRPTSPPLRPEPASAVKGPAPTPAPDRLELARAYLDLGDTGTARGLLMEVAAGDDPAAREQATRLLRDMA